MLCIPQWKFFTNDIHHGMLEMLYHMVISLTIISKSQSESHFHFLNNLLSTLSDLYKCSLVALCSMVVHHKHYVAQETAPQRLEMLKMASKIVNTVLIHFGLRGLKQYLAFLERMHMFDRGKVLDIHSFLHAL